MTEEREAPPPKQVGTLLDELAGLELAAELEFDALTGGFVDRIAAYEKVAALAGALGIEVKPLPFRLANGVTEEPASEPPQPPPEAPERPAVPQPASTPRPVATPTPRAAEAVVGGIDGEVILLLSKHPDGLSTMALGQLFKGRTPQMKEAIKRLYDSNVLSRYYSTHGARDLASYKLKEATHDNPAG